MIQEILELGLPAFIALFVVIDPVGVAPLFANMTQGDSRKKQVKIAFKGTLVGGAILLFFAIVGERFLEALGISMEAFKTAGGLMLLKIALDMVFEKRTKQRRKRASLAQEGHTHHGDDEDDDDISVFPIGVPFVAGPGSISTIMLLMGNASDDFASQSIVLGALGLVLILSFFFFAIAGWVMRFFGTSFTTALTRVLGIVLAALAVQLIFNGITEAFL